MNRHEIWKAASGRQDSWVTEWSSVNEMCDVFQRNLLSVNRIAPEVWRRLGLVLDSSSILTQHSEIKHRQVRLFYSPLHAACRLAIRLFLVKTLSQQHSYLRRVQRILNIKRAISSLNYWICIRILPTSTYTSNSAHLWLEVNGDRSSGYKQSCAVEISVLYKLTQCISATAAAAAATSRIITELALARTVM